MRVLVDMDGVIADLESGFLRQWRNNYSDKFFIPLEKRKTFYIVDQYPEELKEFVYQILWAPRFFRNLEPIPDGIEALIEMSNLGIEIFLCSSPLLHNKNCAEEKYEWVEAYLGESWVKKLILTKDKTIVRANFLIDDRPKIEGVDTPTWEHILYDQPYNQSISSDKRMTWGDWKSILLPHIFPEIRYD